MKTNPTLRRLQIIGDTSVKPVRGVQGASYRFLIIGPTGAGKSSFIESLTGKRGSLSISKDQLAGYTQDVRAYELVNTRIQDEPVFLIDTPGFSDTKISEIEIVDMIRAWLKDRGLKFVDHILFLTPINSTRLAGTKRRTIAMVKEFLEGPEDDHGCLVFVTTMWDTLHNDRVTKRAESNYDQLCNETFKDYVERDAKVARFMNTRTSALQILDMPNYNGFIFRANTSLQSSRHLYEDLYQRIESAIQQRIYIECELAQPEVQAIPILTSLLERNYAENELILRKFITQLVGFGAPPSGYEEVHQDLIASLPESIRISYHPPRPTNPKSMALTQWRRTRILLTSRLMQNLPLHSRSRRSGFSV
ncbi:P-loop containing nucleoside triphosphate hydrolase protein [Panaeolus papilionaceus]|nr:P-loop containing nucleoside triphosphate hydrolase protein [Panaeolus papilionaceus]